MSTNPTPDPEILRKMVESGKTSPTPTPKVVKKFIESDASGKIPERPLDSIPQTIAAHPAGQPAKTKTDHEEKPLREKSNAETGDPNKSSANKRAIEELVKASPFARVAWAFFTNEGKAVKSGWLAVIILCGLSAWGTYVITSSKFAEKAASTASDHKREIDDLGKKFHALERELDDVKRERDKAQSDLAPVMILANQLQKNAPPDKRLDLVVDQLQSLKNLLGNSTTNPINEPIASITSTTIATAQIETQENSQVWSAALAYFASGSKPIVTTYSQTFQYQRNGPGTVLLRSVCSMPSESDIMGRPISSLLEATYIQIEFPQGQLPENTKVLTGQIVWVINNKITLKFEIPEQLANKGETGFSAIFVRDLKKGFSPLTEGK